MEKKNNIYGLLGKKLSHSFSKTYFNEYFIAKNLPAKYFNFEIDAVELFKNVIHQNPNLKGLNVTIPYKQSIIPLLTQLSEEVESIGAVNCIEIQGDTTIGHNTDYIGFLESFQQLQINTSKQVLILGNGGASKAVQFALQKLGFAYTIVTTAEKLKKNCISYFTIINEGLAKYPVIINCTPLGMYPSETSHPLIPYSTIDANALCYDLVYHKERHLTGFLNQCKPFCTNLIDGFDMLLKQADACKKIWKI